MLVGYKSNNLLMSELSGISTDVIDAIYRLAASREDDKTSPLHDFQFSMTAHAVYKLAEFGYDLKHGTSGLSVDDKCVLVGDMGCLIELMVDNPDLPELLNMHDSLVDGVRAALARYLVPVLRQNTPIKPIVVRGVKKQQVIIGLCEDSGRSELTVDVYHYHDESYDLVLSLRVAIDADDNLDLENVRLYDIASNFNIEPVKYCLMALSLCGIGRLCNGKYLIPQTKTDGNVENVDVESLPHNNIHL